MFLSSPEHKSTDAEFKVDHDQADLCSTWVIDFTCGTSRYNRDQHVLWEQQLYLVSLSPHELCSKANLNAAPINHTRKHRMLNKTAQSLRTRSDEHNETTT